VTTSRTRSSARMPTPAVRQNCVLRHVALGVINKKKATGQ
jgi:hypothetical protein